MAKNMKIDILIIGPTTAGIQAAIYAKRKNVEVIVLGKTRFEKKSASLLKKRKTQAEGLDAVFCGEDVSMIEKKGDNFLVKTSGGKIVSAKALVLAMDIHRKELGIENEKKFHGRGVSYCAECDRAFFKNKEVVVVGDKSDAVDSALLLMDYASRVYLVARGFDIGKDLRKKLGESGIKVYEDRFVKKICGDEIVESIVLDNGVNIRVEGVFIEVGAKSPVELAISLGVLLDEDGYISVNKDMETSVRGVYACGDITGPPLRFAKAVREGCIAGTRAAEYVRSK